MKNITIDLLRHGDVANGMKLLGKTDEPLTELGWQQMRSVSDNKHPSWHKIISSPLQRCYAFSEEKSNQLLQPLVVDERFQEMDFGEWDGRLLSELYNSDESEKLIQFMQRPSLNTPPQGEYYDDFKDRVLAAWEELLHSLQKEQVEHCLLVTHGGVIRVILSYILGLPSTNLFRFEVPYACLSRVKHYEGHPSILSFHGGVL